VTAKVQELPAASVAVQLVPKTEKAEAFVPPMTAGSVKLSGPVPVLLSVNVCAADVLPAAVLGNVTAVGASVAVPTADETPVPVRLSVTLGVAVLSVAVTVSVSAPADCGEKLKTSVQLAFGASDVDDALQVLAEVSVNEVVAPESV
jgi:hypothetical protein